MVLTLASALAISAAAYAADPSTDPAAAPPHNRFQQRLGLTDDQMNAIRGVHTRHAAEQKQIWQSLRQAQGDLRQLALGSGDPAAIKAKSAEVAGLLAQATELRAATLQEIAPILTPEQRDQLAKMSPRGRWHHRHGPPPAQGS
jgi:Spy/CpxP family protein refolding chaperone